MLLELEYPVSYAYPLMKAQGLVFPDRCRLESSPTFSALSWKWAQLNLWWRGAYRSGRFRTLRSRNLALAILQTRVAALRRWIGTSKTCRALLPEARNIAHFRHLCPLHKSFWCRGRRRGTWRPKKSQPLLFWEVARGRVDSKLRFGDPRIWKIRLWTGVRYRLSRRPENGRASNKSLLLLCWLHLNAKCKQNGSNSSQCFKFWKWMFCRM